MDIQESHLKKVLTQRPKNSHKGDYGRILLIGGFYPYRGAIIMAAQAAVGAGAGLVTVASQPETLQSLHSRLPEAMGLAIEDRNRLDELLLKQDVVALGPGTENHPDIQNLLGYLLDRMTSRQVLILDGGALTAFRQVKKDAKCQLVLTPHQKEFEALTGLTIDQQADPHHVQEVINQLDSSVICILKKSGSQIYEKKMGQILALTIGGPHQATGGMGDCLVGVLAAIVGQFKEASLLDRLAAGLYLHSWVADQEAENHYVVTPSHLAQKLSFYMKQMERKD